MEAIQFTSNLKTLKIVKIPIPKISHPREVLVKVAYSGVCGTDLHIIQGEYPCSSHPITLGHEFSATVVDFGSDVSTLSKGDRVVVDPNSGCHKCRFCHSSNPHFCPTGGFYAYLGVENHGGWADYCLCSIEQVHKLSDGISLKVAALTEPLSCIAHGWDLINENKPVCVGDEILVVGAGIIGTLWGCLLHLLGHRRVTIVEKSQTRKELIKKLINETGFKLIDPEGIENEEEKFDLVIDCTGNGPAIEREIKLLNSGGKLCIFGVAPPGVKVQVSPFDIYVKELTIISVKVNPFSVPKAMGLVEAMADKYLKYDLLGIETFRLEEYSRAVEALKKGSVTKAMFKVI